DQPLSWQQFAKPPEAAPAPDPSTEAYLQACGQGEAALHRVATHVANLQLGGAPEPDMAEVVFALRSQGSPYVWPRVWTLEGGSLDQDDVVKRIQAWVSRSRAEGQVRCGISKVSNGEHEVLALIAVDALADLQRAIPLRQRTSTFVRFEAHLRVQASDAQLVVLGPGGRPKNVLTSLSSSGVTASFSADQPGRWVAQLLATTGSGPRPLLEVEFYADVDPPSAPDASPVPGEGPVEGPPETQLLTWLNATRASQGLGKLRGNPQLDKLARAHAEAMRDKNQLAHDVGDGNPKQRIVAAGLTPRLAGENVARARTLERAHRTLWLSPSHRGNLLHPGFKEVGIGIVQDEKGNWWVAELFAAF
ncbi:MAG: CAP domain-containing protein, partial [Myxococcales bacterium]|nr:CAP domain-containing protein [Myxococcales bacterium]